jgi:hypothetical protein
VCEREIEGERESGLRERKGVCRSVGTLKRERVCVCASVGAKERESVCVPLREKERKGETWRERERKKEREHKAKFSIKSCGLPSGKLKLQKELIRYCGQFEVAYMGLAFLMPKLKQLVF